eukprot:CAMPEP_0197726200 /NCGR_PEP_ID=MMETSP1434-20131217/13996_1 /TAXON_ID=265543 /ORGANISM="Minutocellus polymorphus, Strain CCMP3303" /LENGTH=194 /DNA_ID=CAMNT_0043312049 /DNA_START=41 /DNA_END=625 /DNA_ORIENTATION=-
MSILYPVVYIVALSHLCAVEAASLRPVQQLARSRPGTPNGGVARHKQDRPNSFHYMDTSVTSLPRGGGGSVAIDDEGDQDDALAKLAESVRSAIDKLLIRLGLKQVEIPPPPVEKPSIMSRIGLAFSIIGVLVAVAGVVELAGGNADLFLQLDATSILIAALASALSSADIARIMNRGVISLGILLGSMHLLTV